MGAIQDSINSMITTAAIGTAGIKHIAEEHAANVLKAPELKSSIADAEKEIGELKASQEAIATEHPELGTPMEKSALRAEEAAGGADLAKAKEAMKSLSDKLAAKTAQKAAFERTLANIGKTPIQILAENTASKIKSAAGKLFGGKR